MLGGKRVEVDAHGAGGHYRLDCGDRHGVVSHARVRDGDLSAAFDGDVRRYRVRIDDGSVLLHDGERRVQLERVAAFAFAASAHKAADRVIAPMPGRIVLVKASLGDSVVAGQELLVMEAMKMELSLKAPHAATIVAIQASAGDFVEADAVLVRFSEAT
jgi:3-methylcrotonyl-CoA carboxylase alpha subunit